ncbi:MAG: transcription termination/antitermination protein NusG [Dehalococcoidia bacterium]
MPYLTNKEVSPADPRWFVIRTKPRAESAAADELQDAGFEVFFPRVKTTQPKVGSAYTPLFPGYLLLRCSMEGEQRPSLEFSPHTTSWVSFGGVVPSVPDRVVSEVAERVSRVNNDGGLWRRFKPGERVRIVSNSVESLAEVVDAPKSPQAKVKVLMHFMGRLVSAQVPWGDIRPVEGETSPIISRRPPRRTRGKGRWIRGFESPVAQTPSPVTS